MVVSALDMTSRGYCYFASYSVQEGVIQQLSDLTEKVNYMGYSGKLRFRPCFLMSEDLIVVFGQEQPSLF